MTRRPQGSTTLSRPCASTTRPSTTAASSTTFSTRIPPSRRGSPPWRRSPASSRPSTPFVHKCVLIRWFSPRLHTFASSSSQRTADQADYHVRRLEDVAGGKAQQTHAGVEEPVLPAVVAREGVSMNASVVLEAEPLVAVIQVRSAHEAMKAIANGDLGLRPGQAA